ncbi:MAG: laccase domain-containing protein [Kineosporiaceae bacterium]|nr:laccase domain-containing protein [Kineosporiaceae bacterium]
MPLLAVDLGPDLRAGFTRRTPGACVGSYAEADLAQHVGDDPESVALNRAELARALGAPVVFARQVHGVDVVRVTDRLVGSLDLLRTDVAVDGGADALITADPALGIGVLVADCVPVLLADPGARVVATAHAGRVGLLAGVLDAVLDELVAAGADLSRTRAALGPCAGPCCYEVPAAMREECAGVLPAVAATTTWGTPSLDLRAGCRAVLAARGVGVRDVGGCTIEDEDSFSHRRAQRRGAATGRFAGVIRLLP